VKRRRFPKKKNLGRFKSPLEKSIYDKLVRIKNKEFNFQYEGEKLKYFTVHNYSPDIVLTFPGGKKIYVEIKGYLRYEDQVKMRAVKNANPDIDIRFVFPPNGRVGGSKLSPGEWCDKYGFPYTMDGKIPTKWMKLSTTTQLQPKSVSDAKRPRNKHSSIETTTPKTADESTAKTV